MKITYQEMIKQKTTTVRVKLDGKQVGKIKQTNRGWEYFPEGKRTGGAVFQTLAACKASLGKRIIDAQWEWDNATAKFANLAEQGIKAGWIKLNGAFWADDWDDLHAAMKHRNDKQEAFLRAVAGVPE